MNISINLSLSIGGRHFGKTLKENRMTNVSLSQRVKQEADKATARCSYSTAANYLSAIRSLHSYLNTDDIRMDDITEDTLVGWQRWLLDRHICLNTVSAYMRSLRSVYNKTSDKNTTLFQKVFTGNAKTIKRSIGIDELRRLLQLQLPPTSFLSLSRDVFLFCFYCQGMPFVDAAFLRKEEIYDGHLHYARHKTGQAVSIALNAHITRIIRRYNNDNTPFVFSLISSLDSREAYRQYRRCLSRYNMALRYLGRQADICRNLSSYVARHSWASIAYQHNVDLQIISRAMGHTDIKTTKTYIRELDSTRIAEANDLVINCLHND